MGFFLITSTNSESDSSKKERVRAHMEAVSEESSSAKRVHFMEDAIIIGTFVLANYMLISLRR